MPSLWQLHVPSFMFFNACDPVEGRALELRCGDYFKLGLQTDLLVISAWDGFYEPEPDTIIAALEHGCGIRVKTLPRAHDFTRVEALKAWISVELDSPLRRSSIAWGRSQTPPPASRSRRIPGGSACANPGPQPASSPANTVLFSVKVRCRSLHQLLAAGRAAHGSCIASLSIQGR